MKKITLFLMFLSALGSAQVSYNSADFAAIGDEFLVSHAVAISAFDFVATGENHSWDFSGLTAATQETISWENPNNSGYKTYWCFGNGYIFNCNSEFNANFNLASKLTDGIEVQGYGLTNVVAHYQLSASELQNKMIGATITVGNITLPLATDYTAPDVVYHFPIAFDDTYTTSGSFSIDLAALGFPLTYTSDTQRTNTVEGWGSLATPFGAFPNVLKMKTTLVTTTTVVYEGQSTPTTTTTVSYKWFDPAYGIPVMEASGELAGDTWIPTDATYIDNPQCLAPVALFGYFPVVNDYNLETQSAAVSFINVSGNYDSAAWDFGDGNTSDDENPSHSYSCPGTYDVTLTLSNSCNPEETGAITIPLVITDSANAFTTGVTVNDNTLTADRNLDGTTYQWVLCDGNIIIPGATAQDFTAGQSGSYAVMLSTNSCESISDCYDITVLGNAGFDLASKINLYPNPTTGILQLSDASIAVEKVAVYNVVGLLVGDKLDISNQSSGVYFVKITTAEGSFVKKVIRK